MRRSADSQAKALSGKSIAIEGYLSISGVPTRGSPNTSSSVGLKDRPTAFASAAWSIRVNIFIPFETNSDCNRSMVSETEYLLGKSVMPFALIISFSLKQDCALLNFGGSFLNHLLPCSYSAFYRAQTLLFTAENAEE
jgi:hypothetical protein